MQEFRRQILAENGPGGQWRLPMIAAQKDFKAESIKLRDTPREMMFGEWIAKLICLKCAAYAMHPSEINWSAELGAKIDFSSDEAEIEEAKQDGLQSFLEGVGDWLTEEIIRPRFPDLVFWWEGLDRAAEAQRIKNLVTAGGGAYMSMDEVRAKDNLPPALVDWKKPGDVIANPMALQWFEMQQQAEQQKQQVALQSQQQQQTMAPDYEQGDFGQQGQESTLPDGQDGSGQQGPPQPGGGPAGPSEDQGPRVAGAATPPPGGMVAQKSLARPGLWRRVLLRLHEERG
jgi:hypothetical protein